MKKVTDKISSVANRESVANFQNKFVNNVDALGKYMVGEPTYVRKTDKEYLLREDKDKDFVEFDNVKEDTPEMNGINLQRDLPQRDSVSYHSSNLSTQPSVKPSSEVQSKQEPKMAKSSYLNTQQEFKP